MPRRAPEPTSGCSSTAAVPGAARDYALHVQERTGFPADGTIQDLLAFCGYAHLKARNLETSTPATLMASIPGRFSATRFFAPDLAEPPDAQAGSANKYLAWRTVVRLVVEAGSPAAARGLGSIYLLFTVFQPTADLSPDTIRAMPGGGTRVFGPQSGDPRAQERGAGRGRRRTGWPSRIRSPTTGAEPIT